MPFVPTTLALMRALRPTIKFGYFLSDDLMAWKDSDDRSANSFLIFNPTLEMFKKDNRRVEISCDSIENESISSAPQHPASTRVVTPVLYPISSGMEQYGSKSGHACV